ncbi:MAG: lipid A deacylase LpxR family protein [Dongia sp.]
MPSIARRFAPALGAFALTLACSAQLASATDYGRISLTEENDSIYSWDDRYYTQGFEFGYLSPDLAGGSRWHRPFDWLSGDEWWAPFRQTTTQRWRNYEVLFGQSIFTAHDISIPNPDPDDRPYAGWLYAGIGMDQDTEHQRLDHLELLAGIVGPDAQGRLVQNDWHQFIGIGTGQGWDHQLHDEPGFMLSYERKYRFWTPLFLGQEVDAIPEIGATVGNVMTYGETGLTLRFGENLRADYGQARIRPSSSGTQYFNGDVMDSDFGYYFYVAAQGRAVGRNIFLDGNTFEDSRSVDKKPLVGDVSAGLALFWSENFRLDGSVTYRTKEFDGQDGNTLLAGFNIAFGL